MKGSSRLTSEYIVPITAFPDTIRQFQEPRTPPFSPPPAPEVRPDLWSLMIETARVTYITYGTRSPRRRGFSGI